MAVDDRVDPRGVHRLQAGRGEGAIGGAVLGPEGVAEGAVVEAEEIVVEEAAKLLVELVDPVLSDLRGDHIVDAGVDEEQRAEAPAQAHLLEEPGELAARQEELLGPLEGGVDHTERHLHLVAHLLELADLLADPGDLFGDLVGLHQPLDGLREGLVPALVVEEPLADLVVAEELVGAARGDVLVVDLLVERDRLLAHADEEVGEAGLLGAAVLEADQRPQVVVADQELDVSAAVHEEAERPEEAEVVRPLVEAVAADDEGRPPGLVGQLKVGVLGARLGDRAGGDQRAEEGVGVRVHVAEEVEGPIRPEDRTLAEGLVGVAAQLLLGDVVAVAGLVDLEAGPQLGPALGLAGELGADPLGAAVAGGDRRVGIKGHGEILSSRTSVADVSRGLPGWWGGPSRCRCGGGSCRRRAARCGPAGSGASTALGARPGPACRG